MSDDGGEAIAWLGILLVGLALLALVGVGVAIFWWISASLAKEARRRSLEKRAGEEYDYTVQQQGLTLPIDDSMDMLFAGGLDFKPSGGLDNIDVVAYATGGQEDEDDPSI